MLPELFLERMQTQLGEEYEAFLKSLEGESAQALRKNSLKKAPQAVIEALDALFSLEEVPWARDGYYYDPATQPGRHVYHAAGLYYIQEPSAMAPVGFLDVRPGERVLDLCAAPGGKSTQIGALLQGKGFLLSNEIHPARARILSENVERMGLVNACVTNESPEKLAESFPGYFDKILVDAPCSGEGMFRKNEIALTEWSPENVQLCGVRQDGILDCAARMLRPGGRMVYSTCTFSEWENEGSVGRFLEAHPEFSLVKGLKFQKEQEASFDGMLRLYPHQLRGEGHFLAVLQKQGEVWENGRMQGAFGLKKTLPEKECAQWLAFCGETLTDCVQRLVCREAQKAGYIRFGDNLYLVPEDFPEIKGLKVLRPGLHLGEIKKDRFEPSHALALALGPEDVRRVWQFSGSEDLHRAGQFSGSEDLHRTGPLSGAGHPAAAYLNGQTFPADGEKGWYLICADGVSLGWGKLAGGIMKNHYPKGLRTQS